MKTSDVMTQDVISVAPTDTVQDAVQMMLKHDVSGLPVISSDRRLVGIVTEGDLLRRAELGTEKQRPRWIEFLKGLNAMASEYVHTHARKVEDVMTRRVEVVTEDTPLADVVHVMERKHVKRLPVMRGPYVVGIVSRANLLHALAAQQAREPKSAADADIRKQLMTEIDTRLDGVGRYNVVVKDGVVHLWGTVFINPDTLRVAAETIPGVKDVRSHLVWIDPQTGMVLNPYDNDVAAERDRPPAAR